MKIVSLQADNILKIKAIHIKADGKSVTLTGKNGAGKTSVLRSIEMAMGGQKAVAELPIHGDEEHARIILDLGDIIVTRTFSRTNSQTSLRVSTKEGANYPSPQAVLDKLMGQLAFDPLEFTRMRPDLQLKTLKTLVGLDFSELDAKRQKAFDERTIVNRDLKIAQAKVGAKTAHPDAPAKPVSITELMDEMAKAEAHNRSIDNAKELWQDAQETLEDEIGHRNVMLNRQRALEEELAEIKGKIVEKDVLITKCGVTADHRKKAYKGMVGIDIAPISAKIREADGINEKVRENAQLARDTEACNRHLTKQKELTAEIDAVDLEKRKLMEAAKFPMPDLGFTDSGVTLAGYPFSQVSQGDQLRASAAIGIALNPKLRVLLVRDASLLDDDAMVMLHNMAKEADAQLWLERVGSTKEVAVEIEEGS